MESIVGRIAMPPDVSSLLSTSSSSQSVLWAREPPTESEKVPRVATSLLAAPIEEAVRVGFLGGARRESCQLHKVAAVEREIGHLLRRDYLAERWIRGLDGHFGGADFDGLADRRGVEREIDFALLVNLQADIFLLGGLEALGLPPEWCKCATGSSGAR